MPKLPSGRVTFLFTDMEGSTRLLRQSPSGYAALLTAHRRDLREAFRAHDGVEVDTQGDAFFVAFARADDAVAAAGDAQRMLAAGPVSVRMAIHSGRPALTDEGYVGIDVHRAARMCAVAHGGQVVLSQPAVALLEGAFPLRDLGLHRLKDLGEPERLYQLGEQNFPPLRSLNATNLPSQPTPLVGREHEVADVVALVGRDDIRLVTVTGTGGSGKTRLALQVAADVVEHYVDGVFWVSLGALRDPELLLPTIGATLRLHADRDLAEHVEEKRMLLLLDNFEQLLPAAAQLAELLGACSNLHLLVTSRAPLRIAAEYEYELHALVEDDAVAMFTERAQAVRSEFAPDEHVAAICRRVDCLPLALELAAARMRLLTSADLLAKLDRRLPVLTGGARNAPVRQQTLRATIEWSYGLLDAAERLCFARLAVFPASFTLEAAEDVCGCGLDLLSHLVEQSLVRRWASSRFGMLETIREYALERFEQLGEVDELRCRHIDYLLALSAATEPKGAPTEQAWLQRVDAERDNIRGALSWSLSSGYELQGLQLATCLGRFWLIRDHREGFRWLSDALARADGAPSRIRAEALGWAGSALYHTGDYAKTSELYRESLELLRRVGDQPGVALILARLAGAQLNLNEIEEARASIEESLSIYDELGDREGAMYPLEKLGWLEWRTSNRDGAIEHIEESLARAREFNDSWWEAQQLSSLGEMALESMDIGRAERFSREGLALSLEHGDRRSVVYCLALLALVAARRGKTERAGRLWGGLEALERAGDPPLDPHFPRALAQGVASAKSAVTAGRAMAPDDVIALALQT
jgi:predicted ATPase/class 3 adenylate cyclase